MLKTKILCFFMLMIISFGTTNLGEGIYNSIPSEQQLSSINSENTLTSRVSKILGSSNIETISLGFNTSTEKSWIELGPKPIFSPNEKLNEGPMVTGRITSIAINQSNPNIIYVGAAQGGVWKTTDGGQTWIPLMDNQLSLAVGSIIISPDNKTIFVGTGEPDHSGDSCFGNGILKSTNEGNSWQLLGSNVFENSSISSIIIDSTNPNLITASTTFGVCSSSFVINFNNNGVGIFHSKNGGQTWQKTNINGGLNKTYSGIAQLLANPRNTSIIYAAGFNGGIYESQDSGQSWLKLSISNPAKDSSRSAIAISRTNPNVLYIAVTNSKRNLDEVLTYDLSTKTTTVLTNYFPTTICNQQCQYNLVLAVDPINPNIMYFGGVTLLKSYNKGISWTIITNNVSSRYETIHGDFHALAFYPGNPNKILVGSDGGVFTSNDGGSNWSNLNRDIGITQFDHIAASPTNDSLIIGGSQDNGCDLYSNSTYWTLVHGGDGESALFYNDSLMICNYQHLGLLGSNDGGYTWYESTTGINKTDKSFFIAPMAQDYLNRSIIYFGSTHLYKSMNFGASWQALQSFESTANITTITLSTTNPYVIAVGDENGIVRLSTDGGQSFKTILNSKIYSKLRIASIAIDPRDSSHIFVSIPNNKSIGFLVTTNSGKSWQSVQNIGQIPNNVFINVLKYNPITKILFIGTNHGLYYYNGTSFYALGSGLPNVGIWDLTFTASNYVLIATHGRGAWLNYMTPKISLQGLSDGDIASGGTTFTLAVSDPNGLNHVFYNWNNGDNKSISATATLTVPNSDNKLILNIYAQDAAGNTVHKAFSFYPNNQFILIIGSAMLIVLIAVIEIILFKKSKRL